MFCGSIDLAVRFSLCIQVTDQIQIYMRKTLQNDYGVNLDEQWNHFVTESWNKAQAKVSTPKMYFMFANLSKVLDINIHKQIDNILTRLCQPDLW